MKKKIVLTVAMVVVCFVVILAMVFMIRAQRNKNALSDIKADAEEMDLDVDEPVVGMKAEAENAKEIDQECENYENDNSVVTQENCIVDEYPGINSIPSSTIEKENIPVNITPVQDSIYKGDSMELDTDEDGILDGEESLWGLDYKKEDSDDDGLTDFVELNITLTDPLKTDTDSDGVTDALADIEGDGLDNQTELFYNTNPLSSDTDGDNLTDYEEIFEYNTNPLLVDTDMDGLTDYEEICWGINPLENDSDNDGVLDNDEKMVNVTQKEFENDEGKGVTAVRVDIDAMCSEHTKVNISSVYEMDILSQNVLGLVGVPVEINTEGTFDKATLYFYYDEDKIGDAKEEDLTLLWYDKESNWYQILDDACVVDIENNRVIYETTHFSTYMLVNSKIWTASWRKNIVYRKGVGAEENPYLDIVFCVDCSSSMEGERLRTAKTVIKNYVSAMQSEDSAAIINLYDDYEYMKCNFTNNQSLLIKAVDKLYTKGCSNINYGLRYGVTLHSERNNDKRKIIILVSDCGEYDDSYDTMEDWVIKYCDRVNVHVYVVDIESETTNAELERIAEQTGGQYYYSENLKDMEQVFSRVIDDTLSESNTTDIDGDGLYDVFEIIGMQLSNGQIIRTDPTKADTDGDGLSDFQETGIMLELGDCYIGAGINVSRKFFYMKSDPTKVDTDEDGIPDSQDEQAWDVNDKMVVRLSNKYNDVKYLKIEETNNICKVAGNQGWWKAMANSEDSLNYKDFATDKNYRLWKMGCGVIAVSDVEIYLMQQNSGYNSSINGISYDESSGIIQKDEYMSYVNLASDLEYGFGGGILYYNTGLLPRDMELGLNNFLKMNHHKQTSVKWAPYSAYAKEDEKLLVLDEIEKMLSNNLPIVFAYYTADKNNPIILYKDREDAKKCKVEGDNYKDPTNHYMTIIGLHKYLDENTMTYEYILEVVSWGDIYYIRYDDYGDNICYFSNILRIQ